MNPKSIIPVLITLMLIVAPATATTYSMSGLVNIFQGAGSEKFTSVRTLSYDVTPDGHAITQAEVTVYRGSYVNFTLYYGVGTTMEGSFQSDSAGSISGVLYTTSAVELDGVRKTYTYLDWVTARDYDLVGYAKDDTNQTGFIAYMKGYALGGYDENLVVFSPITGVGSNLITRIDITGSQNFDAEIFYGDYQAVSESTGKSATDILIEYLTLIVVVGTTIYGLVVSTLYWFKFLFVDNLLMVVALYLTGTMAFAARNARGKPDKFLRSWIKDQVSFVTFIQKIPEWIVNIINLIRRTIL